MKRSFYILLAIAICLLLTPNVFSKLNGSPGAKTDSPTDGNNCTACHYAPVNSGNGLLSITTDIPVQGYTSGQTYSITIQLTQNTINRFGFEITCEEGNFGSNKTGSFGISDPTTTKFVNNNAAVTHTQGGISGSGSKTWSMNWTAPTSSVSGGVVFYVSAIAANGDGNNSGDEVYTTSRPFSEATSSININDNETIAKEVGKFANTQACESRLLPLIMRLAILGSNARDGADKPRYFLMADKLIILPRCCAGKNQMMN